MAAACARGASSRRGRGARGADARRRAQRERLRADRADLARRRDRDAERADRRRQVPRPVPAGAARSSSCSTCCNAGTPECPLAPSERLRPLPAAGARREVDPFVSGDAAAVGSEFVDVDRQGHAAASRATRSQTLHLTFFADGEEAVGLLVSLHGRPTPAATPPTRSTRRRLPELRGRRRCPSRNDASPTQAFGPLGRRRRTYFGRIDAEGEIDRMRAWLFARPGGDGRARRRRRRRRGDGVEDAREERRCCPKLEAKPEQVVTRADRRRRRPRTSSGVQGAAGRALAAAARRRRDAVLPGGAGRRRRRAAPARRRYTTGVTLRRVAGPAVRYAGDVTTTGGAAVPQPTACVVLRHAGSRLQALLDRPHARGRHASRCAAGTRTGGTVYRRRGLAGRATRQRAAGRGARLSARSRAPSDCAPTPRIIAMSALTGTSTSAGGQRWRATSSGPAGVRRRLAFAGSAARRARLRTSVGGSRASQQTARLDDDGASDGGRPTSARRRSLRQVSRRACQRSDPRRAVARRMPGRRPRSPAPAKTSRHARVRPRAA